MHAWMKAGMDFLEAKRQDPDVKEIDVAETGGAGQPIGKMKYGVIYKVLKRGKGHHHPMHDAECKVHYEGTLHTGEPILNASTYGGEPHVMTPMSAAIEWEHPDLIGIHHSSTTDPVERRVDGLMEALVHMKEGDEWEVYLSPDLAYHIPGVPQAGIPHASVVVFKLKLVEILPGSTKTHLKPDGKFGARHPKEDPDWQLHFPKGGDHNQHLHDDEL